MLLQIKIGAKSAAVITKGKIEVMTLSEVKVMSLLDLRELLDGLIGGFRAMGRDEMIALSTEDFTRSLVDLP